MRLGPLESLLNRNIAASAAARALCKRLDAKVLAVHVEGTPVSLYLQAFDRWSQASRVSINSIKPQWKRTAQDYATLECRVDASGNLGALTRFLFDLEQDPLALKVEAVDLTARDEAGEQLALGLQVSALFLSRPDRP